MRVLGSKGPAVGWDIGPLPYRPPDRRLPIVGRPRPGTSALDTLSARGVCHSFGRFTPRGEHCRCEFVTFVTMAFGRDWLLINSRSARRINA